MSILYKRYYQGRLLRPSFNSDKEYWNYINKVDELEDPSVLKENKKDN